MQTLTQLADAARTVITADRAGELTDDLINELAEAVESLATEQPVCHIAEVGDEIAIACDMEQRAQLRAGMQLYAGPQMPRDVLRKALDEVADWIDANDPMPDLDAIAERYAAGIQPPATEQSGEAVGNTPFYFARYVNGIEMAEGVTIKNATSIEEAMVMATRLAASGPNKEIPVLIYLPCPAPQPIQA
ncbi:hypothetical protein, partial [Chromobacterium violaceum]|uniref:hypothetical protein n=1 Tax=Chromobacterium violaceum TaxID=536 RepID=UPI0005B90F95